MANALLLAAASLLAASSLKSRLGAAAPLWVAVFVFASISFVLRLLGRGGPPPLHRGGRRLCPGLWRGADRRAALPASIYQGEDTTPSRRVFGRFLAAGALLAVAGAVPAVLPDPPRPGGVPAALGLPAERRRSGLSGIFLGALVLPCSSPWGCSAPRGATGRGMAASARGSIREAPIRRSIPGEPVVRAGGEAGQLLLAAAGDLHTPAPPPAPRLERPLLPRGTGRGRAPVLPPPAPRLPRLPGRPRALGPPSGGPGGGRDCLPGAPPLRLRGGRRPGQPLLPSPLPGPLVRGGPSGPFDLALGGGGPRGAVPPAGLEASHGPPAGRRRAAPRLDRGPALPSVRDHPERAPRSARLAGRRALGEAPHLERLAGGAGTGAPHRGRERGGPPRGKPPAARRDPPGPRPPCPHQDRGERPRAAAGAPQGGRRSRLHGPPRDRGQSIRSRGPPTTIISTSWTSACPAHPRRRSA